MKCDGTLLEWFPVTYSPAAKRMAWCSRCFKLDQHIVIKKNALFKSIYQCEICKNKNIPCAKCPYGSTLVDRDADEEAVCLGCSMFAEEEKKRISDEQAKVSANTLDELETKMKDVVFSACEIRTYISGELVVPEGSEERRFWFLNSGKLRIEKQFEVSIISCLCCVDFFCRMSIVKLGLCTLARCLENRFSSQPAPTDVHLSRRTVLWRFFCILNDK